VLPSVVSLSADEAAGVKQRPHSSSERTVGEHTIADIAELFSAWSSFTRWACHTPSLSALPAMHGQRFQRPDLVRGPAQYDLI